MSTRYIMPESTANIRRELVFNDPDDYTKGFTYQVRQIADPILKEVNTIRDIGVDTSDRALGRHVARVPLTVYFDALQHDWDDADWNRYLDSSEASAFRTWNGQLSNRKPSSNPALIIPHSHPSSSREKVVFEKPAIATPTIIRR